MIKKVNIEGFIPQILAPSVYEFTKTDREFFNSKILDIEFVEGLVPGRSFTMAIGGSIGNLEIKPEGEAMAIGDYNLTPVVITPLVRAKQIPMSLESNAIKGNLIKSMTSRLKEAYLGTINQDVYETVKTTATVALNKETETITLDAIIEAMGLMQISNPSKLMLFVSHKQVGQLLMLKDANGNSVWAPSVLAEHQESGIIGFAYGIPVVVSELVVAEAGTITNYIVEEKAVKVAFPEDYNDAVKIDGENDKAKLIYILYAHAVYGTKLMPDKKVQPITFKE